MLLFFCNKKVMYFLGYTTLNLIVLWLFLLDSTLDFKEPIMLNQLLKIYWNLFYFSFKD